MALGRGKGPTAHEPAHGAQLDLAHLQAASGAPGVPGVPTPRHPASLCLWHLLAAKVDLSIVSKLAGHRSHSDGPRGTTCAARRPRGKACEPFMCRTIRGRNPGNVPHCTDNGEVPVLDLLAPPVIRWLGRDLFVGRSPSLPLEALGAKETCRDGERPRRARVKLAFCGTLSFWVGGRMVSNEIPQCPNVGE